MASIAEAFGHRRIRHLLHVAKNNKKEKFVENLPVFN